MNAPLLRSGRPARLDGLRRRTGARRRPPALLAVILVSVVMVSVGLLSAGPAIAQTAPAIAQATQVAQGLQVSQANQASPAAAIAAGASTAIDEALARLATGESTDRDQAIDLLAAQGGAAAERILRGLGDGALVVGAGGATAWIAGPDRWTDARSGAAVPAPSPEPDRVRINNRVRNLVAGALASMQLFSPDLATRRAAARALLERPDPAMLSRLDKAIAAETNAGVLDDMQLAAAMVRIDSSDAAVRLAAVETMGGADRRDVLTRLNRLTARQADGRFNEPDARVRTAATAAGAAVERRLDINEYLGRIFAGLSLGSILMLAAIGLAITYGLLGVINMAHGEMLMIGAYSTYVTQSLVREFAPGAFALYPIIALPVAFVITGLVGIAIERLVIRHLYGRPLETLLATWGVSLILIQAVRTIFGPQNVGIENPGWMSGAWSVGTLSLPYNRIAIIAFSLLVLGTAWLVLSRTRLGLFVRGVTQNRAMAGAIGVPTGRVDMLAFGLGSGFAGLAGVALSQIGNVGPELGQAYIIDSFIVVVAGGVGQLLGAVTAGFGLGILAKFIEPSMGAVIAKILILVLVIAFIQRRPQGLFALRERTAE